MWSFKETFTQTYEHQNKTISEIRPTHLKHLVDIITENAFDFYDFLNKDFLNKDSTGISNFDLLIPRQRCLKNKHMTSLTGKMFI